MDINAKRPLIISRGWVQAAAIVLVVGFFIMGVLAYYTYNDEPPIPNVVKREKVVQGISSQNLANTDFHIRLVESVGHRLRHCTNRRQRHAILWTR